MAFQQFKKIPTRLYLVAALVALFGATHVEWPRAPYSRFGKAVAWAANLPEAAYNFAEVNPGRLYRSGEPDAEFLRYVQRRYGIKYVVSLIGPAEVHQTARNLGMEVTVLDWRTAGPTTQDFRTLLSFLNEKTGVLVHCHAGRDRTGYVIALYRMQQQHWSVERAEQEMEAHGHSQSHRLKTKQLLQQWLDELTEYSSLRS